MYASVNVTAVKEYDYTIPGEIRGAEEGAPTAGGGGYQQSSGQLPYLPNKIVGEYSEGYYRGPPPAQPGAQKKQSRRMHEFAGINQQNNVSVEERNSSPMNYEKGSQYFY